MSLERLYTKIFKSAATFSFFKTITIRIWIFRSLKTRIFVGYSTRIIRDKNAKITINGNFSIDSKNDGQFWYYSNIRLKENSELMINGEVNVFSGMSLKLFKDAKVTINGGTYFSGPIIIHSMKEIVIGENCSIAWNCTIIDSNFHQIDSNKDVRTEKVTIGNNVWIGNNVVVLPGTVIGHNVIVGAGSVVKGVLEENSIYSGNPCVFIRKRK